MKQAAIVGIILGAVMATASCQSNQAGRIPPTNCAMPGSTCELERPSGGMDRR